MRKAKVAAIVVGIAASCLLGGFAVVEAATVTLDDSSAAECAVLVPETEPVTEETETAATVTSIETNAAAATSTEATVTTMSSETTETQISTEAETTTQAVTTNAPAATVAVQAPVYEAKKTPAPEPVVVETKPAVVATQVVTVYTEPAKPAETQTEAVVMEAPPMPEQPVEPETVPVTVPDTAPAVSPVAAGVISESDYILLCNAVGHEAGGASVSVPDKALVVEVIMNRVYSPNYPNTIYGVLTQKLQFSGSSKYVDLGTYSGKVNADVKAAVDLYFADPSVFNHGYLSFTGDGTRNYFR